MVLLKIALGKGRPAGGADKGFETFYMNVYSFSGMSSKPKRVLSGVEHTFLHERTSSKPETIDSL